MIFVDNTRSNWFPNSGCVNLTLPEKEFLENFGKSVRLNRYSHSGKLGMSSKLSASGSRKVGKVQKMMLRAGFF